MDRSELQRLLEPMGPDEHRSLPEPLGAEVLRRGQRLRFLVRQHWKWLRWASLISLLIAVTLGLSISLGSSTESPPSMLLFQGDSEASPFSTE